MPDNDDILNNETSIPEETVQPIQETPVLEDFTEESTNDAQPEELYKEPVTVQPVKFSSFENEIQTSAEENSNLDILMDINLELTVELGRCELPIKKVLELTKGSIIELNKIAGESVDLYANGKHIANGEVVVIGDNFGLRINTITSPEERLKGNV
ncbi:MAG: flagellar motor switch protein FliN [Candidatus Gastranaerophilales bacterium]|nr:flagellar motor switch protein FliN [Candidatus Gastranaerophilales bacterium]